MIEEQPLVCGPQLSAEGAFYLERLTFATFCAIIERLDPLYVANEAMLSKNLMKVG